MTDKNLFKKRVQITLQKSMLDQDLEKKIAKYTDILEELVKQEKEIDSEIRVKVTVNDSPPFGQNIAGMCPLCNHPAAPGLCKCETLPMFEELIKKAPPGREEQVKALKPKVEKKSAFKIAWASYNKTHKAEYDPATAIADVEGKAIESGQDPSKIPHGVKMQAAHALWASKQKPQPKKNTENKGRREKDNEKTPVQKAEPSTKPSTDIKQKSINRYTKDKARPSMSPEKVLENYKAGRKGIPSESHRIFSKINRDMGLDKAEKSRSESFSTSEGDKSVSVSTSESDGKQEVRIKAKLPVEKGENYDDNDHFTVISKARGKVPKQKSVNPKTVPNAVAEQEVSPERAKVSGHTINKAEDSVKKNMMSGAASRPMGNKMGMMKNDKGLKKALPMKPEYKKQMQAHAKVGAFEAEAAKGLKNPTTPPKTKLPSPDENMKRAASLESFLPKGKFK